MPLSLNCGNCGGPKNQSNYADPYCPACENTRNEGMQHFAAENQEGIQAGRISQSDILYAGRMAMQARAIAPGRNYVDPRQFNANRGMIPVPPQSGDRGVVGQ